MKMSWVLEPVNITVDSRGQPLLTIVSLQIPHNTCVTFNRLLGLEGKPGGEFILYSFPYKQYADLTSFRGHF